jgi:hypothetical protein
MNAETAETAGIAEIVLSGDIHSDGPDPTGSPREARQGLRRDREHKRQIESHRAFVIAVPA